MQFTSDIPIDPTTIALIVVPALILELGLIVFALYDLFQLNRWAPPARLRSYTTRAGNPYHVRRKPLKIDLSRKVPLAKRYRTKSWPGPGRDQAV